MPVLDFTEIAAAHVANGLQDTFELFAREFLKSMGFKILADPDRGADGGVDLIVAEERKGIAGVTTLRWLVSCKHKAASGNSVSPNDDRNISDRILANNCDGFMGFYSTLASAGLSGLLAGMNDQFETQVFDREKIEEVLLRSKDGISLARRFFPASLDAWMRENPDPARIFADEPALLCNVCGKNLFEADDKGIVTLWQRMRAGNFEAATHYEHILWSCRGACDQHNRERMYHKDLIDGWDDIEDVMIPLVYIKWVMTFLNGLNSGTIYSDKAFDEMKTFLLQVFPHIARHPTMKQVERARDLGDIPEYLGGLGYYT